MPISIESENFAIILKKLGQCVTFLLWFSRLSFTNCIPSFIILPTKESQMEESY